jgi:hypothetical protein
VLGEFDIVSANFEVEYRNGTEIWARYVPEPASGILVIWIASRSLSRRRRS